MADQRMVKTGWPKASDASYAAASMPYPKVDNKKAAMNSRTHFHKGRFLFGNSGFIVFSYMPQQR